MYTVNLKKKLDGFIFETMRMLSFVEMKPSQNREITLPFTDVGKSCTSNTFLNIANISFNIVCENKILMIFFKFTVSHLACISLALVNAFIASSILSFL